MCEGRNIGKEGTFLWKRSFAESIGTRLLIIRSMGVRSHAQPIVSSIPSTLTSEECPLTNQTSTALIFNSPLRSDSVNEREGLVLKRREVRVKSSTRAFGLTISKNFSYLTYEQTTLISKHLLTIVELSLALFSGNFSVVLLSIPGIGLG